MENFDKLPSWTEQSLTYAGIGSRQSGNAVCPDTGKPILHCMKEIAQYLEEKGYTLNSGGAIGADQAFESGVQSSFKKQIFFASDADNKTRAIAKELHPAPQSLHGYVLDLMARNTFQIFGRNLNKPVDFVLCWTPDGCESYTKRTRSTGGTGQAIEMASRKGIPVINMANKGWRQKLVHHLLSQAVKQEEKLTKSTSKGRRI